MFYEKSLEAWNYPTDEANENVSRHTKQEMERLNFLIWVEQNFPDIINHLELTESHVTGCNETDYFPVVDWIITAGDLEFSLLEIIDEADVVNATMKKHLKDNKHLIPLWIL